MNTDLHIYGETVAGVLKGEKGPHIGAFFDFDGTVISGYSIVSFLQEQLFDGLLLPQDIADLFRGGLDFKLGTRSYQDLMVELAAKLRGVRERSFIAYGESAYERKVARMIYPETRALIQAHLQMGHTVAVVSSATPYQVEPALEDLQVDHLMCTRFEVDHGYFTGKLDGEACFGAGKVNAVNKLAEEHGIDIDASFFYSDSDDDLLVLEHVGRPQVLNPNSGLKSIAQRRGWPVRAFGSRGNTDWMNVIRNLAAVSTFVPTALTGAAMWWLTGSKREGRNFVISTWSDLATALMGITLEVTGEENLWLHRPAVIIFNHQSNIDPLVLCKLLRRDAAPVGKKELADLPIVGPVFDFMGMIPIDRSNTESAVKTLAPLADFMHAEKRSIVIAPEGTRSLSTVPGRFKKGPFRIAMQAGVPIIPVVIHNSSDAQPKGELFARPMHIAVDVLPPIDVSDWALEHLEEHIDEVRDVYLDTLGLHDEETELLEDEERDSAEVIEFQSGRSDRASSRG